MQVTQVSEHVLAERVVAHNTRPIQVKVNQVQPRKVAHIELVEIRLPKQVAAGKLEHVNRGTNIYQKGKEGGKKKEKKEDEK